MTELTDISLFFKGRRSEGNQPQAISATLLWLDVRYHRTTTERLDPVRTTTQKLNTPPIGKIVIGRNGITGRSTSNLRTPA